MKEKRHLGVANASVSDASSTAQAEFHRKLKEKSVFPQENATSISPFLFGDQMLV